MFQCFLLSMCLIGVQPFSYYMDIIWKAGYKKNHKLEEIYTRASKSYLNNPKSVESCVEALYASPRIDPEFAHFFKNFVIRNITYNDANIIFPPLQSSPPTPYYSFLAHASGIEEQMIKMWSLFYDYIEATRLLRVNNCLLQEISDAFIIILQHCPEIEPFQAIYLLAFIARLTNYANQFMTNYKIIPHGAYEQIKYENFRYGSSSRYIL